MPKLFAVIAIVLLSACSDLGYYWHSTQGHLSIMNKRVEITTLLEKPDLDVELRSRLLLVQQIRRFSIDELALPDSGSYTDYVDLDRPYALQNLFAAPEFSTHLLSWCYPIVGCASYRGYYDEDLLADFVADLEQQNVDIHIGEVPAYSTLGWFDDPVLSSFVNWTDYRLAGLLFHELTHQRLYIDDDTQFNESLASAVQQMGTELWLESLHRTDDIEQFRRWIAYRKAVVALIEQTRTELDVLYQTDIAEALKRDKKQQILAAAGEQHTSLAASLEYVGGFSRWFANGLNNAKLASVSAYSAYIPAFLNMMEAKQRNFAQFFDTVETIGALPEARRYECLAAWQLGNAQDDRLCLPQGSD
ncbi:MAG: putative aminopeptidase [Gammaproteobacteria bacterium]|jgi:predicted aminopeptidase